MKAPTIKIRVLYVHEDIENNNQFIKFLKLYLP